MKHHIILPVLLCAVLGAVHPATASVNLRWQVETSRLQPVVFDAVRGETLALEAFFNSYGNPLSMAERTYSVFYQTNGMGSAWWTAPATVSSNTVSATITPYMVPSFGTSTYPVTLHGFLGSTGDIYRAAFTIRFRNGPGATPNVIDGPVPILDLAHTVVVNPPWPTTNDFQSATNVMQTTLKTYVDEQIEGAGVVSPSTVTNITTNVVTKAYVEGLGIESGLDTNAVMSITTNKRDIMDMNVYHVSGLHFGTENIPDGCSYSIHGQGQPEQNQETTSIYTWWLYKNSVGMVFFQAMNVYEDSTTAHFVCERTGDSFDSPITKVYSPNGNVLATTNDINSATRNLASLSSLSSLSSTVSTVSSTAATLATQVSTIGAHLNAEDARFVSTNYNSATHMPEAYVEIKLNNDTWSTIWREMTRFNWLTNSYLPTNYSTRAELDQKADRAWGYYDSHTGSYAPDGFTWISSPRIAIAAGLAYQRTVTSEGAVWVLESNGLVPQTGGETNGFFRITDDEGNTQFEIVKGNKRTIGADASSCEVVAGFSPTKLQIGYSIQSDTHPTIEVTGSLSSPSWKAETDAGCLANVTWSGSSGAYVAQVQAKTAQPSLFVRATYQSGGETYINNSAPVAINHLYLGGVKYAVSTNTISGHIVLTLTPSL